MKITVEVIPHNQQRYNTCGDWQWKDDTLAIKVSDTGDWRMNFLVARHEIDEAMLCKFRGVSEEDVDKYDFAHPDAGDDCFSDDMEAPYHNSHCDALASEWTMSRLLGVEWIEYNKRIEEISNEVPGVK